MSQQYLLDGYNILHQMPTLSLRKLEEKRNSLIRLIEYYRPQGSLKNQVTIVFDGQAGIAHPQLSSVVKVVFSCDETADEKIKQMVARAANKKNTIVVTDDRDIQYAVRALGGKICSVQDFLSKTKAAGHHSKEGMRIKRNKKETKKYISKNLEWEITSEFEQIWLTRNNKTKRP